MSTNRSTTPSTALLADDRVLVVVHEHLVRDSALLAVDHVTRRHGDVTVHGYDVPLIHAVVA